MNKSLFLEYVFYLKLKLIAHAILLHCSTYCHVKKSYGANSGHYSFNKYYIKLSNFHITVLPQKIICCTLLYHLFFPKAHDLKVRAALFFEELWPVGRNHDWTVMS